MAANFFLLGMLVTVLLARTAPSLAMNGGLLHVDSVSISAAASRSNCLAMFYVEKHGTVAPCYWASTITTTALTCSNARLSSDPDYLMTLQRPA